MKNLSLLILALVMIYPVRANMQALDETVSSVPKPSIYSSRASTLRSLDHKMATSGTGAIIGSEPIYDPAGVDELWIMDATEYDGLVGESPQKGEKMHVRRATDGKTIWFRDLIPLSNYDALSDRYGWVEGTIEGDDITVKAGQVLLKTDYQILYLETVEMDEAGNFKSFHPEMHFTIEGDKIVQADNKIYASVYEDAPDLADAGFFVFANKISMQPITGVEPVTPPVDATFASWILRHADGVIPIQIASDGEEVYIKGLSSLAPEDYVKGTLKDDVISINPFQILLSNNRYFLRLGMATEGEQSSLEINLQNIEFHLDADGKSYVLSDDWLVTLNYDLSSAIAGYKSPRIFQYEGDVPAVPATPTLQFFSEVDMMIQFRVPSEDVEGNYINSDSLSYRFYLDGALYTFTPTDYIMLEEPMTLFPYTFTDNFDIYSNGDIKTFFLHTNPNPKTIEVESIYTIDGITNTSRAKLTAIDQVIDPHTPIEVYRVDLLGRPVNRPEVGSLVIRITRFADGTVRAVKEVIQ